MKAKLNKLLQHVQELDLPRGEVLIGGSAAFVLLDLIDREVDDCDLVFSSIKAWDEASFNMGPVQPSKSISGKAFRSMYIDGQKSIEFFQDAGCFAHSGLVHECLARDFDTAIEKDGLLINAPNEALLHKIFRSRTKDISDYACAGSRSKINCRAMTSIFTR